MNSHRKPHLLALSYAALPLIAAWLMVAGGCTQPVKIKTPAPQQQVSFWPPPPAEPRIQFVRAYEYSRDVEPAMTKMQDLIFGDEIQQVLPISKPYGVEMWQRRIYVCDIRNAAVSILDLRKQEMRVMGSTGMSTLGRPVDIAIAPDGMKYVADIVRNRIFVFDAEDKFVTTFGHDKFKPVALAVRGDELFVCDFVGQCVEIFDRHTGQSKQKIGGRGMEDGKFIKPMGIGIDPQGNLVVVDVLKCRVQVINRAGEVLHAWGMPTDNIGNFVRPKHLAVDKEGYIYVVDAAFQNVQIFSGKGQLMTFFGSMGTHPGAMYLPAGISVYDDDLDLFEPYIHPAFKAKRLLIVTNQFGHNKVAVYALGQLRPGKTLADIRGTVAEVATGTTNVEDTAKAAIPIIGDQKQLLEATPGDALPDDTQTGTELKQ